MSKAVQAVSELVRQFREVVSESISQSESEAVSERFQGVSE